MHQLERRMIKIYVSIIFRNTCKKKTLSQVDKDVKTQKGKVMNKEKKHLQLICRHARVTKKGGVHGSFINIEPDDGNLSQCKICGKRVPFAADVANKAAEAYASAP